MKLAGRRRGFKSWFVEPYRQVKLGLLFIVVNLVFSALFLGVFGYYVFDIYESIVTYFAVTNVQAPEIAVKFSVPVMVGGGLTIVFIAVTILLSVKYTHQIYGPLVSIKRFLDDLIAGRRPAPIQLRESDQLKELAEQLNAIGERVGDGRLQAPVMAINRYLDTLLAGGRPEPLSLRDSDNLGELEAKLNKLADSLQNK